MRLAPPQPPEGRERVPAEAGEERRVAARVRGGGGTDRGGEGGVAAVDTDGAPRDRGRAGRWAAIATAWLLAALVGGEIAARVFWRVSQGIPPGEPAAILTRVLYPELQVLDPPAPPGAFSVLVLAGSVLADDDLYNRIPRRLAERLQRDTGRPVVAYDLAQAGHGTRDSLLKYRAIGGRHFDLVVVYHGINDARANNAPPEVFRDDYGHYAWYAEVNAWFRHPEARWLVLPFTLESLAVRARERLDPTAFVPRHIPRPAWLDHGGDVRTAGPFRANLEEIVRIASGRREPVVLMSFAWYLPDGYSLERMKARSLDYTDPLLPVEAWGKPEKVARALGVHNAIVRDIAAAHPELPFVDQERLVPRDGRHFRDVCHLSPLGAERFIDGLAAAIAPRLGGSQDGNIALASGEAASPGEPTAAGRGAGARSPGAGSPTSRP